LRAAERLDDRPDLAALLEARDREYLTACRDAETAGRRRVRLIRASFAGLTLLLAAGGVGWWKQDLLWQQYRWQVVMRPSVLSANQEKQAAAQSKAEFKECANGCPVMVVVPAGTFTMGSADDQNDDRPKHRPPHEVTIAKPFAVSKTEVTFGQWGACVAARACPALHDNKWGGDDRPVINVGWNEAEAYADWLSRLTGRPYRLLSEAEWEYAARAGSPARYAFGDDAAALEGYAWYRVNSDARTQPVGKKQANAFGLHDMHGK
jgi:formylglycine-generating enzyme required for sulfatase activity